MQPLRRRLSFRTVVGVGVWLVKLKKNYNEWSVSFIPINLPNSYQCVLGPGNSRKRAMLASIQREGVGGK